MGIYKHIQEFKFRVAAKRMFKALVTDIDIIPLPYAINSIDVLPGNSTRAGTIRKINFAAGGYVIHEIEVVDTEKYKSKHTLSGGPMIGGNIKLIRYDSKFKQSSDGGCIAKISSKYYYKGDIDFTDEDANFTDDQVLALYKLYEEYLLAHPHLCT